ncbi:hypothetical protein [Loktanella sp. S4079]|uniref:hypothetical protein n=1 Tax=Loktanella sp. S4079 TaxID=579483 RepID=UPI0005FA7619|nr:hypothetical protein [Loktanella sp. S4079]KJZ20700.1 hypothetical protein TW80_08025 [Loktanella sp. S4079]
MHFVSHTVCSLAGLILSAIGFIGLNDIPASPIESLTILLEPLGYGPTFDAYYHRALILLGIWLVAYIWTRAASGIALILVLLKIVVLNGWAYNAMIFGLGLIVMILLATVRNSENVNN